MSLKTAFFLEAIQDLTKTSSLPTTIGKVIEVKDEGYLVDIELSFMIENMQKFQNIPVLKNKYSNSPILKDDIVILIPLSHLLQGYLDDKKYANDEMIYSPCYLALPMAFKDDFEHKNELSFRTPEKKFLISLNDEKMTLETEQGLKVEMDLQNLAIELQGLTIKAKGDIKLESSTNLILKGNTPLEIGNSIATIGAILKDICTALNLAGSPVTTGSATTTPNPALAPKVAEINTKIGGSFK